MSWSNWLWGSEPQVQQASTMTQGQTDFADWLRQSIQDPTGQGIEWLQQLLSGEEGAFAEFEAPFKRQFEQQTVPGIAERFAGMGSGGSGESSAFQQTMGQAGRELSENLAAQRSGLKMDAMKQLQSLIQPAQQPQFENIYDPGRYGAVSQAATAAAPGAAKYGMQYFLK